MKVCETSEKRPLLLAQLNQYLIFNRGPISEPLQWNAEPIPLGSDSVLYPPHAD
jgi:hypothetical protein